MISKTEQLNFSATDNLIYLFSEFKNSINKYNILCLGAGFVGISTMTVFAEKCQAFKFYVVDIDKHKIDICNSDKLPFYEYGLKELILKNRNINLFFSTEIEKYIDLCDIIFVCVNTSTSNLDGSFGYTIDLKPVKYAAKKIADNSNTCKIIIEKSTVPVLTSNCIIDILKTNQKNISWCVLSNPEFISEGTAIQDLLNPNRIVIGGPENNFGQFSIDILTQLYKHWVPNEKILVMNTSSSELTKLIANAFLAQRISSINSISDLCELTGADINEISLALGYDTRIGSQFLKPSIGFGGSCFKKDLQFLIYILEEKGLYDEATYWRGVIKINQLHKKKFAEKIISVLKNNLEGKIITIFGFSFKNGTSDVRESAAIDICHELLINGGTVSIYDPNAKKESAINELLIHYNHPREQLDNHFIFHSNPYDAVSNSSSILITTEEEEFKKYDYKWFYSIMSKNPLIFDGRNILNRQRIFSYGFDIYSIGQIPLLHK